MPFGRHRRSRTSTSPQTIHLVLSGHSVQQVFTTLADAERFARDTPGARVNSHPVRTSVDEAVVVFDRRVVVAQGTTVLDRTNVTRLFLDGRTLETADVEWFHDAKDAGWHIAGFGIDESALDAKMQHAIERVRQLSPS